VGCGNVDVVDVDVDVDVRGLDPAVVPGSGTSLVVVVVLRMVVVVLASARSPATIDGSGGTAARAGAHAAQHRIPTVTTARRRGLTGP
jgi:hypothetical protein